jgi:hypothetical protein
LSNVHSGEVGCGAIKNTEPQTAGPYCIHCIFVSARLYVHQLGGRQVPIKSLRYWQ